MDSIFAGKHEIVQSPKYVVDHEIKAFSANGVFAFARKGDRLGSHCDSRQEGVAA